MISTIALAAALQSYGGAPPIIRPVVPPPVLRPAPPPPPRFIVSPPQPVRPLASYVLGDDYPAEAMRNEEEGLVAFRLHVGTDGRVIGCTITSSSGSASLDETTCAIMQRRARFTPAMARGVPAIGTMSARVRWQFAPDPDPRPATNEDGVPLVVQRARPVAPLASLLSHRDFPAALRGASVIGTSRFQLAIDAQGRVTACETILTSQSSVLDAAACALMRERARFTPARDTAGNPAGDDHWGHIHWRTFAAPPVPAPPILPPTQ